MTNEMIIFNERMALMEAGKIRGTGRFFELEDENGEKRTVEEPEEIHTFTVWKDLGFSVKKGEKAISKLDIWKYTNKKKEETEEAEGKDHVFRKTAFFFSLSQVEPLKRRENDGGEKV